MKKMKPVPLLLVMPFYYWLCLCNLTFGVSGLCLDDQKSLLLQLKNNVTIDSWDPSDDDCCAWMGITCDKEGHVTGLDLTGGITRTSVLDNSSSLFSLQHLTNLNLRGVRFHYAIPTGFNKLTNLTNLDLSDNLSMEQQIIPTEISQLTRLVSLDLSESNFTGRFPPKIFQIPTLSFIDISYNENLYGSLPYFPLSGSLRTIIVSNTNFSDTLPHSIGNLRHLSTLDLSDCQFNGTLPNSLSNLTELTYLDLSSNKFTGPVPSFGMAKNLSHLDLSHNGLSGAIPSSHFEALHNLFRLDLSYNSITGSIPSALFTLPFLKEIRFSDNKFSQLDKFTNVSSSVLATLDLNNNNLSGPFPEFIFQLTALSYLSISSGKFHGPIQLHKFWELKNLDLLDVSYNNLSVNVHMENVDPSSFPNLIYLNISSCNLKTIPDVLRNQSSLQLLDLSHNQIQGIVPNWIWKLDKLQWLDISRNLLTELEGHGPIVPNRDQSNLQYLDLSHNQIQGIVPNWIWKLDKLQWLDISRNLLTELEGHGPIVPNRDQSNLQYLDLSHNQIQGIVPSWIWKLENLRRLDISSNLLTELEGQGPIVPNRDLQNVSSFSNLELIDLHNNQLQGPIPILSTQAYFLDYSRNNFSSVIPDSLCNATGLIMLDLSINNLSGTIPSCLTMSGPSSGLQVLNLKDNNLTGHIPDMFPGSCNISTLNLHGNHLHGPIPKSLANCSELELLDLGKNQITGGFPCFLRSISTLRVLVLRNNKLQGSLGCGQANNNKAWKILQIVDIAFNNFSGKLEGKYFTNWDTMMHHENQTVSAIIHSFARGGNYQGSVTTFIERLLLDFIRPKFTQAVYYNYQDSVTVVIKGLELEFVKILTVFTSIDFSSNQFEGPIPEELMNYKALLVLNLSNNALSGKIPPSIGSLKQLESLDLSHNSFHGEIPVQLASLTFLSYLNLSFNHLVGKIPTGSQLQLFEASSFEGNDGLHGPPLDVPNATPPGLPPQPACSRLACSVDWNFLSAEIGFTFGLGIFIGPLMFWRKWRIWYWKLVDKILCWIFPQLYLDYVTKGGQWYTILRWWRR